MRLLPEDHHRGCAVGAGRVVAYGPGINAAAVLLSSEGNVPVERAAALMEALLGTPVSSGFVARALARLADRLRAAGFDEAMKDVLWFRVGAVRRRDPGERHRQGNRA